jgi:hypothetical protein
MIRKLMILLWLLFPVGVLAFHFSNGEPYVRRERAKEHLKQIEKLEAMKPEDKDWGKIISEYDALEHEVSGIEPPRVIHQIRLAKAKARLESLDIATAIDELTSLLQEAAAVHGEDAPVTRSVRETLGKAHYYATCLLQANNSPESEWRPYAERSRQLFRFLAEHENPTAFVDYEQRVKEEMDRVVEQVKHESEGAGHK